MNQMDINSDSKNSNTAKLDRKFATHPHPQGMKTDSSLSENNSVEAPESRSSHVPSKILFTVTYGLARRTLAILPEYTTDAQLKELLQHEFALKSWQLFSLEYADVILPVSVHIVEHLKHYRLRVYPLNKVENVPTEDSFWKMYVSSASGYRPYYYNSMTGESTWNKPPCMVHGSRTNNSRVAMDSHAEGSIHGYDYDEVDAWEDHAYFESYTDVSIHTKMVGDKSRCEAYRRAIEDVLGSVVKNRVVLDVGCGTGLLSLMAARAGAKRVFAVEASGVADVAEHVFVDNSMSDRILLLRGKMEEVDLPEKVDVIISEWMGSALLFESMLDSVLYARDNWLSTDGPRAMLPSHARVYVAPIEDASYWNEQVGFWKSACGFDMNAAAGRVHDSFKRPVWDRQLPAEALLAPGQAIANFEILTMKQNDMEISGTDFRDSRGSQPSVKFSASRVGVLRGFALWFDVLFTHPSVDAAPVILDTSPSSPATHWHQDLLFFTSGLAIAAVGQEIEAQVELLRHPVYRRHFNVRVRARVGDNTLERIFDRWHPREDLESTVET